ncbi:MAG: aminodeoxychorismate/anthranilate synthase component II [Actinomycetota bacterium]|nr:aminodeoxychorismate/anthranilate synthase component II [Actinomycetota bacterium]
MRRIKPATEESRGEVRQASGKRIRTVLIDNYDSFTYNLAQYLAQIGSEVIVFRNDEVDIKRIEELDPSHLVISPGPGGPADAGISCRVVSHFLARIPVLGVCLGHQVIGHVMGGEVVRGSKPVHGKVSLVYHDGETIFADVPNPLRATRYHSLVVERKSFPEELEISAETEDGIVMGLRHRKLRLEGVQFHPESVLTEAGLKILSNFLML